MTLFEETIHDTTSGVAASVGALAVMLAGTAALAARRVGPVGGLPDEARQ